MPKHTAAGRKGASTAASSSKPSVAASKAQYEAELKGLASKAQADGASTLSRLTDEFRKIRMAIAFLFFAGFFAHASQLSLAPVYGGIPASRYHLRVEGVAAFAGWAGNLFLARALAPLGLSAGRLLPLVTLISPVIQYLLDPFSAPLGAGWGPLVVEALTVFPVVACCAACAADTLDGVKLFLPKFLADSVPGMGSWALFLAFENLAKEYVMRFAGRPSVMTFVLTRVGMQMSLGGVMAALSPSLYLLVAVPALLHTVYINPHMPTVRAAEILNGTLQTHDWLLIDREESNTGYVSVLQSLRGGFRVLRCDHSLLGGEYTDDSVTGGLVPEPIYGVFAMLEAVRLVQTEPVIVDNNANALVM